jgi:hypothetical protein
MRRLLLLLVPCSLLSAAPSGPARDERPPERPVPVLAGEDKPLTPEQMEQLARERPVEFVEKCLLHYRANVHAYRLTMYKQERIGSKLEAPEVMQVAFREHPFSVFLKWDSGARRADRSLYIAGEPDDKIRVRPTGTWYWAARAAGRLKDGLVDVDVDGDDARQSGRFTLKEFGMYNGLARLLADWDAAQKKGALHVEYLPSPPVERMGNRPYYALRRTQFLKPERAGVTEQIVYVDRETLLQIGSVANSAQGLVGAYYYRDIEINPEFAPDQFTAASLKH